MVFQSAKEESNRFIAWGLKAQLAFGAMSNSSQNVPLRDTVPWRDKGPCCFCGKHATTLCGEASCKHNCCRHHLEDTERPYLEAKRRCGPHKNQFLCPCCVRTRELEALAKEKEKEKRYQ